MATHQSTGTNSGFKHLADSLFGFGGLPVPSLVLSSAMTVLVASEAMERLLAWPNGGNARQSRNPLPPSSKPIFDTPFDKLGIELLSNHAGPNVSARQIIEGLGIELMGSADFSTVQ